MYGLLMTVTHSLLLGDVDKTTTTTTMDPTQVAPGLGGEEDTGLEMRQAGDDHHWFLQLLDLDIGFGHELLGFDDYSCLICGLLYGILIIALCGLMFNVVFMKGPTLPIASRWFVAFINLEIVVYVGLVLCKLPKLCKLQENYLPTLSMECHVLRFLFMERVIVFLTVAGLSCWTFSSLAYVLTVGNQVLDRPEYAHALDLQDHHSPLPAGGHPGNTRVPNMGPAASGGYSYANNPARTRPPVGSAVAVSGRQPMGTRSSLAPPHPYNVSYNLPRNSSSMVTTTTAASNAERAPMIKGPTAYY